MKVEKVVQVLLALVGCFGTYILYGMRDEMMNTRTQLTSLATSVAVMVEKSNGLEKRVDKLESSQNANKGK